MMSLDQINQYLRYLSDLHYQELAEEMFDEMMFEFELLMYATNSYECCNEYGVPQ